MSMKRRGFLGLLGAAIGAPMMPGVGAAAPARSAFDIAVAHAQRFPVISVAGLSKHGKMTATQADAMIKRLAVEGQVKLVGPSRSGGVRAASRLFRNDHWGLARTAHEHRTAAQEARQKRLKAKRQEQTKTPQIAPWLAHLHDLCRAQGMVLSPRCFA